MKDNIEMLIAAGVAGLVLLLLTCWIWGPILILGILAVRGCK